MQEGRARTSSRGRTAPSHWPGGSAGSPQCVRSMELVLPHVLGRPALSVSWATRVLCPRCGGVGVHVSMRRRCPWASWLLFTGAPALGVAQCGVLSLLAPIHQCARSVCCVACAVYWASWPCVTGASVGCSVCAATWASWTRVHRCTRRCVVCVQCPGPPGSCSPVRPLRCVVLRVRCPGPPGSCSPVCPLGVLCCPSVRCPGPPGSCSPVCPLGVLFCVCGVLGLLAPVHRCARSVCCFACAVSWAYWLLFSGAPARCVVLRVRCSGPPGSCSPVRPLGVSFCVCGVLGLLARVHRCTRSMCCLACAVSWAYWLLFSGAPARCVVLRVRCSGPPGSCSPVRPLGVSFCVCGVLGLLARVHRCTRSMCCLACAVSWASWLLFTGAPAWCVVLRVRCPGPSWLLFTGVPARCVVLLVRCPGPPGSCSPVCPLGVLFCVCGVLGLLAPFHRCACSVCCFACAVSWALLALVHRCACSVCCVRVCGVLGLLAPVHRCARSVCCFACAVSWASWLLFNGVPARCVVLRVRCPGPIGSCSPVCPLGVLCCVCGVLGLLAPVHWCARSVCCFACAVSWASWLPFTGAPARCVLLRVRCPGPPGSWSPVRLLGVLCCVCGVLGLLAPVHRCARSVCCVACPVSWASWLLFTGAPARCVVLCVRCPGPPGSCSPVCPLGVLCCVCGVLGHLAPVHRCAHLVCCVACAVSWASWLLYMYIYIYIYIYVYIYIYIYINIYIYIYIYIYPLIYTPLPNSRWLDHMALRYTRRVQLGAYSWRKGLNLVKTGSKWAKNTCFCTPNAPGSLLEKRVFDAFLTDFCSQNSLFSRHLGIFCGPQRVTTGSKWAKNTCLSIPNGVGSRLEKCVFDPT